MSLFVKVNKFKFRKIFFLRNEFDRKTDLDKRISDPNLTVLSLVGNQINVKQNVKFH